MRVDNGEILDIIYTTDSLLVTTPRDSQTSLVIAKHEADSFCATSGNLAVRFALAIFVVILFACHSYILAIHLILKGLRSTMAGTLLVIDSTCAIVFFCGNIALTLLHNTIALNTILICRIVAQLIIQMAIIREACTSCLIACAAHVMYRSDKFRRGMPKYVFKSYMAYILGTLVIFNIFSIIYDEVTGDADQLLLPSGHCDVPMAGKYDSMTVMTIYGFVNKFVQLVLFGVYMFYYFKYVTEMESPLKQIQDRLAKIAMIIGATVGLHKAIFWLIVVVTGDGLLGVVVGVMGETIQDIAITMVFMCNKKVTGQCTCYFKVSIP